MSGPIFDFATDRERDSGGRFAAKSASATPAVESGAIPSGLASYRQGAGQGAYSTHFRQALPRLADPEFYEVMREAIPILNTAIIRLIELDGSIQVEAETDKLEREAKEWMAEVQVNDFLQGYDQALALWRGESYEQGFGVMELVPNQKRNDIVRINVPDSKRIWFTSKPSEGLSIWYQENLRTRRQTGATIAQTRRILQPSWGGNPYIAFSEKSAIKLPWESVVVGLNNPENNDPHGVSVLRSVPLVAKILLTIEVAVLNNFERFGDPSYVATQKGNFGTTAEKINAQLAADLKTLVDIKRQGGSADLTRVIGKDDDFSIQILGADNQVLTVDGPSELMTDQIVVGVQLSRPILGLQSSSPSDTTKSIILAGSRTRFAHRKGQVLSPIVAALRCRGHAFRLGDVNVTQVLPDFEDILKSAQTRFMDAQRIRNSGVITPEDRRYEIRALANDPAPAPAPTPKPAKDILSTRIKSAKMAPVEERAIAAIDAAWLEARRKFATILGLPTEGEGKSAGAKAWQTDINDPATLAQLKAVMEEYYKHITAKGGYYDASIETAIDLGAAEAAIAAPLLVGPARDRLAEAIRSAAFDRVKNKTFLFFEDEIKAALAKAATEGQNGQEVARWLWQFFDGKRSDWARLARTELSMAMTDGKFGEWEVSGIKAVTSIISNPSCDICGPKAGTFPLAPAPRFPRDTHPNCTCTTRPATDSEIEMAGYTFLDDVGAPAIPDPEKDAFPWP